MKKFSLIEIYWEDCRSPAAGWEFLGMAKLPKTCKCRTVGYLIKKTKSRIVVAQNVGDLKSQDPQMSCLTTIPTRCIIWSHCL